MKAELSLNPLKSGQAFGRIRDPRFRMPSMRLNPLKSGQAFGQDL